MYDHSTLDYYCPLCDFCRRGFKQGDLIVEDSEKEIQGEYNPNKTYAWGIWHQMCWNEWND